MSGACPPPDYQGQGGDCREDKKRRLQQGHHGESSSRLQDEDLEIMFSSLTIDSILSEGTSGDCCNNRKRKSCQESAGDLVKRSPDDILESMFSALAIQETTFSNSVSRRPGEQSSVLAFGYHNMFSDGNSGCTTSIECNDPDSGSLKSDEFIDRVNDRLLRHDGTGVKGFEVHFDLNSTHAAHLDKWVQFASKSDAQYLKLHLCKNGISCSRHSVTESRYNFPLQCFGYGQSSSLRKLSLTNCIFVPSVHSGSLSSLVGLYLMRVTTADSDIQNILSCCPVLRSLRLGSCNDLVNIRISSETLIHLNIYNCKKLVSIEINSSSLFYFEYEGHKVDIKYVSTPNMRRIVTNFWNRNCSLSKHLNDMKMKKVTLTFLSPLEGHGFIQYANKFFVLKFVDLFITPSWDNVLAVAYLLEATPYLTRLRLEARSGQHHYLDNAQVSWPMRFYLKKLRAIFVGGFAAQAPLIKLVVCLVRAATGLKYLQINAHHHLCKLMGKWVREEDVGDEAARDHARNAARETIGPKLRPSVKLVIE